MPYRKAGRSTRATKQGDPAATSLGFLGATLLFLGAFLPIVHFPIVGSQNYVQNGQGDGVKIIGLALLSLVLLMVCRARWLIATGGLSIGLLIFTFASVTVAISEVRRQMDLELAGNPYRGLADAALGSIELQWGWAVLLTGASLTIAAGAIARRSSAS